MTTREKQTPWLIKLFVSNLDLLQLEAAKMYHEQILHGLLNLQSEEGATHIQSVIGQQLSDEDKKEITENHATQPPHEL